MRIVITGATGHLGSFLLLELSRSFENIQFILIDRGGFDCLSSDIDLNNSSRYTCIKNDIQKVDFGDFLQNGDIVIHLAAMTNASKSFSNKNDVISTNVIMTKKIVDACIQTGSKLVFPSTTSVYAATKNKIIDEQCAQDDLSPQSPYAESKLQSEKLVQDAVTRDGLKAVIFRMGSVFGISSGMNFHTAINKFCLQASRSEDITIWKTAYEQMRPFVSLNDVAGAYAFAIKHNIFDGRVYNLVSLNTTVKMIINEIQKYKPSVKISLVDSPSMNNYSFGVSNDKFTKLGFTFSDSLGQEIRNTINYVLKRKL